MVGPLGYSIQVLKLRNQVDIVGDDSIVVGKLVGVISTRIVSVALDPSVALVSLLRNKL